MNLVGEKQLLWKILIITYNGDEVFNVTATYICKDFSDQIVVNETEGKDAKFFSVNDIPEKISPPVRVIIDDFILDYQKIIL